MKTTNLCNHEVPTRDQRYLRKLATVFLICPIIVFLLNGCTNSLEDGLPGSDSDDITYHSTGWKDNPQHRNDFFTNPQNCKACHGEDLTGGSSGVSCSSCHHSGWGGTHAEAFAENPSNCKDCHGEDLAGGLSGASCVPCHHSEESPQFHHGGTEIHVASENCDGCHGELLRGGYTNTSCRSGPCHPDRDKCSPCHETLQSHPVHTVTNSTGPTPLGCEVCHDEDPFNYAQFADGHNLNNTAVCDNCHSPDGAYKGVTSSGGSVGAKDNWENGVYDGSVLASGKEKWCAGCHDEQPANSKADGAGVDAPKVLGDAVTYGYYKTGHGRNELVGCLDCHDTTATHIDHEHRTYALDESTGQAVNSYCDSYRLKDIDGQPALNMPRPGRNPVTYWQDFFLCLDCHDRNALLVGLTGTNLIKGTRNHHNYHLGGISFDSDWDNNRNNESADTCITCHNVHGSPTGPMLRHGELISTPGTTDWVPSFNFYYLLPGDVPDPTASAIDSIAGVMAWGGPGRFCGM